MKGRQRWLGELMLSLLFLVFTRSHFHKPSSITFNVEKTRTYMPQQDILLAIDDCSLLFSVLMKEGMEPSRSCLR